MADDAADAAWAARIANYSSGVSRVIQACDEEVTARLTLPAPVAYNVPE